MEAIRSSETSVQSTTSTRRHTPEDGILHSHRRENLKSYVLLLVGHPCSRETDSVFLLYCKYSEIYICSAIYNELLIIHQAALITCILIQAQGCRQNGRDKNVNDEH
jgi:hypothetical protein